METGEFVLKVLNDLGGASAAAMCMLGDRLGLFKDLHHNGPSTVAEFCQRTGVKERYAREWLSALTSAAYLEYDPETGRFSLPPDHAPCLAEEDGRFFVGGFYQMLSAMLAQHKPLARAFREGGGVPQDAYDDDLWDGMERLTGSWIENGLVDRWIPAMPGVREKLESGASVADVGCGRGRALFALARAFPASRFVGYDIFQPMIDRATAAAEALGLADQVRFEQVDAAQRLPGGHDLVTTFQVIHDLTRPLDVLRSIRGALKPDGAYLLLETTCCDRLELNVGPVATALYGMSVQYCTTHCVADGGEALGMMGMPEPKVREMAATSGFSRVQRLPFNNLFYTLYDMRI